MVWFFIIGIVVPVLTFVGYVLHIKGKMGAVGVIEKLEILAEQAKVALEDGKITKEEWLELIQKAFEIG